MVNKGEIAEHAPARGRGSGSRDLSAAVDTEVLRSVHAGGGAFFLPEQSAEFDHALDRNGRE